MTMGERYGRDLHDGNFGGLESCTSDDEDMLVDACVELHEGNTHDAPPAFRLTLVREDGEHFEAVCSVQILQFLRTEIEGGLIALDM